MTDMDARSRGTDAEAGTLSPRAGDEAEAGADTGAETGDAGGTRSGSMIRISPKWQMVLIGGAFIAINIMVMVIFLVVIFLRR